MNVLKRVLIMKEWKRNQVIFIDKPNKEKIRPITMSSCVAKILERMVNDRLSDLHEMIEMREYIINIYY